MTVSIGILWVSHNTTTQSEVLSVVLTDLQFIMASLWHTLCMVCVVSTKFSCHLELITLFCPFDSSSSSANCTVSISNHMAPRLYLYVRVFVFYFRRIQCVALTVDSGINV